MQVKFGIRNIEKVKAYIASVPRPLKIEAMKAIMEYIIGDEKRGLKHEPPEKRVSRARAKPSLRSRAELGFTAFWSPTRRQSHSVKSADCVGWRALKRNGRHGRSGKRRSRNIVSSLDWQPLDF